MLRGHSSSEQQEQSTHLRHSATYELQYEQYSQREKKGFAQNVHIYETRCCTCSGPGTQAICLQHLLAHPQAAKHWHGCSRQTAEGTVTVTSVGKSVLSSPSISRCEIAKMKWKNEIENLVWLNDCQKLKRHFFCTEYCFWRNCSRGRAATAPLGNLPVPHSPHGQEFIPYFQSNPALWKFKTVIPCPVTTDRLFWKKMYPNTLCLYTPITQHLPPWGSLSTGHSALGVHHTSISARSAAQGVQAGAAEGQHTPDHSICPAAQGVQPQARLPKRRPPGAYTTQHNHRLIAECKANGFLDFPWHSALFKFRTPLECWARIPQSVPHWELATCVINISTTELSSLAHWRMPVLFP